MLKLKKSLLIADPQIDFCPKGALGVPEGDKIMKPVNEYMKIFTKKALPVFVTRDWHPKVTKHFKKFGGAWPVHCIQDTKGAEFHPALKLPKEAVIMSKGMDPEKDSYSAFESFDANGAPLANLLKIFGIEELYIGGLATDYCVKNTALDALRAGFKVKVLADAIKGVNLKPRDSEKAIKEMLLYGAELVTLAKIKGGKPW